MKNYKILFVEDDPDFRTENAQKLRDAGFEVVEAEGETSATELLRRDTFDLAIVDLVMETADSGFTLCYHIKKKIPGMPTILITGINEEMELSFSLDSEAERDWIKAEALLNKPMRFEQILFEVQRLLKIEPETSH